jgi:hypothetical protein
MPVYRSKYVQLPCPLWRSGERRGQLREAIGWEVGGEGERERGQEEVKEEEGQEEEEMTIHTNTHTHADRKVTGIDLRATAPPPGRVSTERVTVPLVP